MGQYPNNSASGRLPLFFAAATTNLLVNRSSSAPPVDKNLASALPADLERELGFGTVDLDDDRHRALYADDDHDLEEPSVYLPTTHHLLPLSGHHSRLLLSTSLPPHSQATMYPRPHPSIPRFAPPMYQQPSSPSAIHLSAFSGVKRQLNVSAAPFTPLVSHAGADDQYAPPHDHKLDAMYASGTDVLVHTLNELRANRPPPFHLNQLLPFLVELSCDQHGSRFVQQRLDGTPGEQDLIHEALAPHLDNLAIDVFGNYVVQKLFDVGTERHRLGLARRLQGSVVRLSLQMYGCRVVQSALEALESFGGEQCALVGELQGHVLDLVRDQNGNHVVQRCVELLPPTMSAFILQAFEGNMLGLATHPYGCRVIQRLLEHPDTCVRLKPLLRELEPHTTQLVQDQYGNYVMQHLLEQGTDEQRLVIIEACVNDLLPLARHKFASNVVERCIVYGLPEHRRSIVDYVCRDYVHNIDDDDDGDASSVAMETSESDSDDSQSALSRLKLVKDTCPLFTMMRDQYANYVVQKMLESVESPLLEQLLQKMRPHYGHMRRYAFGKHILGKLERLGEPIPPPSSPASNPPRHNQNPHHQSSGHHHQKSTHATARTAGDGGTQSAGAVSPRAHRHPSHSNRPLDTSHHQRHSSHLPTGTKGSPTALMTTPRIVLSDNEDDFPPLSALSAPRASSTPK
jgi:hypothetical protein